MATYEQYQAEIIENIEHNALGPNDTFRFTCKECGACCRNRATPIMLTGLDIYRMAKGLSIDPYEVLARFTSGYVGDVSHAPVVILRERLDGSCSLLRNGKCMVHRFKPIACAVHPLGRYINLNTKESGYIRQSIGCQGIVDGRIWTLDEWLDAWGLKELDAPSLAWNLLAGMVAGVMSQVELKDIDRGMIWVLYQYMYGEYDTSTDFIPQVERNTEALRQFFKATKCRSERRRPRNKKQLFCVTDYFPLKSPRKEGFTYEIRHGYSLPHFCYTRLRPLLHQ